MHWARGQGPTGAMAQPASGHGTVQGPGVTIQGPWGTVQGPGGCVRVYGASPSRHRARLRSLSQLSCEVSAVREGLLLSRHTYIHTYTHVRTCMHVHAYMHD